MPQEPHVLQDHSLLVDVSAEDHQMDTHAFHAQLDKSLTQLMSMSVLLKQHALDLISDYQEMLPVAEDARDVISHLKFQTTKELLASPDQRLYVTALREDHQMDIHAFNAQLEKLPKEALLDLMDKTKIHA